jgi:methyltransferase (TIGR00027 family)
VRLPLRLPDLLPLRPPLRLPDLHAGERPSSTAQWTTLGRTLELQRPPGQRIVDDPYAPLFLSAASQAVLLPLRLAGPAVRVAERAELAGLSAYALCRHRFIDEHLRQSLREGAEQVVILGAGYDARAYRLADELAGRPVYEVDLPPTSRRKAAIVAAHAERFGHAAVRRVEVDFRTESLAERLAGAGFRAGADTFVAWEGVSPYLTAVAVSDTLDTLRELCGPGSTLAMDFWQRLAGHRPIDQLRRLGARAFALVGEPVTFALDASAVGEFLELHGFGVVDVVQSRELAARYSTGGRPCEPSAYVVAARLPG